MFTTKRKLRKRIAYLEQLIDDTREQVDNMGYAVCESALNHPSGGGEPTLGYWDGFSIFWLTKLRTLQKVAGLLHYD